MVRFIDSFYNFPCFLPFLEKKNPYFCADTSFNLTERPLLFFFL